MSLSHPDQTSPSAESTHAPCARAAMPSPLPSQAPDSCVGGHRVRPLAQAPADTAPAWTALACAMALAVALGVGRFAFTPLLPVMLHDGLLDIAGGGWLASFNYAGYFVGAVTCAALRADPARMIRGGLVATVVLTAAMGLTDAFWAWAALRAMAGVISAWTVVFASQWGLRQLARTGAVRWSGVIYTGPGVGILITGLATRAVTHDGAATGWLSFALLSAALSALVWRRFAAERPTGDGRMGATSHGSAASQLVPPSPSMRIARADAYWLCGLYSLAGFGYIMTATFLPVIARQALPAGSPWPDLFWPVFGAAIIPGALLGARLPAHWDNRLSLAICYVMQAVGIGLGIALPTLAGFALGSLLVGLPFTAITLFAMREARRLHGERAAGLMGYATAAYGLGQIAGPLVAAPIAARTGSFSPALGLALAALLLGAALLVAVARAAGARER